MNILDLNDYSLLAIIQHLNSTDIWQLSRTCNKFQTLIKSKSWRIIDARDSPDDLEAINFCFKNVIDATKEIRFCSESRCIEIIPNAFIGYLKYTNLVVIALENQKICGDKIQLSEFPQSLIELSLRKTYVTHPSTFTENSWDQMKNLKVFILDECFWVTGQFIYILGKYPALEILSVYKCKKLFDFDITFLPDFNKLRIIDCRFSGLGTEFFKYMTQKTQIQEMYFENYLTMYFPTKIEREKELNLGSPPKKFSYYSKLDDIALWDKNVLNSHFGENCETRKRAYGHVNYCGTRYYSQAQYIQGKVKNFKSILYEPPYDKCGCNFNPETVHITTDKKYLRRRDRFPREVDDPFELRECTGYIHELCFKDDDPRNFRRNGCEIHIKNDLDLLIFEHTAYDSDNSRSYIIHHGEIDFNDVYPQTYRKFSLYGEDRKYKELFKRSNQVNIKKLSLRGFLGINDMSLEHMENLGLSLLDVTGTSVTNKGIKQFLTFNPNCRVIHEILCTCKPKIHF